MISSPLRAALQSARATSGHGVLAAWQGHVLTPEGLPHPGPRLRVLSAAGPLHVLFPLPGPLFPTVSAWLPWSYLQGLARNTQELRALMGNRPTCCQPEATASI